MTFGTAKKGDALPENVIEAVSCDRLSDDQKSRLMRNMAPNPNVQWAHVLPWFVRGCECGDHVMVEVVRPERWIIKPGMRVLLTVIWERNHKTLLH